MVLWVFSVEILVSLIINGCVVGWFRLNLSDESKCLDFFLISYREMR